MRGFALLRTNAFTYDKNAPRQGANVIKLRKAGLHRNVRSSFLLHFFRKTLDKQVKMCGLFAICG